MSSRHSKPLALWLFLILALLLLMIVLGGFTRLTESGLSMVNWHPVTGWLPPLNEMEWRHVFADYQKTPEYIKRNFGMTVKEFKSIFWLEYYHRLLGRVIGVFFFFPMVFFIYKGWIKGAFLLKISGLFFLGALQGLLGWYMVKSGLVDRPDVSQYRLAAHLGLALLIFSSVLWLVLDLLQPKSIVAKSSGSSIRQLRRDSWVLLSLIFITILSGAFVAGLDAGKVYNTFPLMDGEIIPDGLWDLSPGFINIFENIVTVQFDHRFLAISVIIFVVIFYCRTYQVKLTNSQRRSTNALLAAAFFQVGLGISTLLLVVPIFMAVMHQLGAVVLLAIAIWLAHEFSPNQSD